MPRSHRPLVSEKVVPVATSAEERGSAQHLSRAATAAFGAVAVTAVAAAVAFTWLRLFVGMDLRDESYYVLVPWRWALGDTPFVQEQSPVQISGFVMYPFVKLFAVIRGYDVTGYVLYMRHLYLLMMIGVAIAVFLVLRRLMRWELGGVGRLVYVTYIFWATPQLNYNTIALGLPHDRRGAWSLGRRCSAGADGSRAPRVSAFAVAVAVVPFASVRRSVLRGLPGLRAGSASRRHAVGRRARAPPGPRRAADRQGGVALLSAWVLGGALRARPLGACHAQLRPAKSCAQLPVHDVGSARSAPARRGFQGPRRRAGLLAFLHVAPVSHRRCPRRLSGVSALAASGTHAARRRAGGTLAGGPAPPALGSGIRAGLRRRWRRTCTSSSRLTGVRTGAKLLIWIWAPAMHRGSHDGVHQRGRLRELRRWPGPGAHGQRAVSGVGARGGGRPRTRERRRATAAQTAGDGAPASRSPALGPPESRGWPSSCSSRRRRDHQLPVPVSAARRSYVQLTSRFDSGPWWGIKVTPERRQLMDGFAADLRARAAARRQVPRHVRRIRVLPVLERRRSPPTRTGSGGSPDRPAATVDDQLLPPPPNRADVSSCASCRPSARPTLSCRRTPGASTTRQPWCARSMPSCASPRRRAPRRCWPGCRASERPRGITGFGPAPSSVSRARRPSFDGLSVCLPPPPRNSWSGLWCVWRCAASCPFCGSRHHRMWPAMPSSPSLFVGASGRLRSSGSSTRRSPWSRTRARSVRQRSPVTRVTSRRDAAVFTLSALTTIWAAVRMYRSRRPFVAAVLAFAVAVAASGMIGLKRLLMFHPDNGSACTGMA